MKVYGWEDVGVHRGEMVAATVPSQNLYHGVDMIAGELGWERARRLAEVPGPWRDSVRRHVEMVFALAARARRRRMARECW